MMGNKSSRWDWSTRTTKKTVRGEIDKQTEKNAYDDDDRIATHVFNPYVGGVHRREKEEKKRSLRAAS